MTAIVASGRHRGIECRKTRIIATLGPASSTYEAIDALFLAGADLFRLNMSHGTIADKQGLITQIRRVEKVYGRPIAVLADLQGPKLRIGSFEGDAVTLHEGQTFQLDLTDAPGSSSRVSFPFSEIYSALAPGTEMLLDDGKLKLVVEAANAQVLTTKVAIGGELSGHKGVNIPNLALPLSPLTKKDRTDLKAVLDAGVDWVALSFVQCAEDVESLKEITRGRVGVLAKIEKPAAVNALDEILASADAVMVARGDLGVELPLEKVPGVQKRIIGAARDAGKPVVIATQMLESMIEAPFPTRAEVSDVANAVFEGADAIMLSAESATGSFGREAVSIMDRTARTVEEDPTFFQLRAKERSVEDAEQGGAISVASESVSRMTQASAIVTFTTTGATARRIAQRRPDGPILVLTPSLQVARQLSLVWGLYAVHTDDATNFEDMTTKACLFARQEGLIDPGGHVVITAGVPFGRAGTTNVLHIAKVEDKRL